MSPPRLLGVALVVIGVVLLIIGLSSSDSLADQVSETFTGRFTKATMWYIVGGAALGLVGLFMTFMGGKKSLT